MADPSPPHSLMGSVTSMLYSHKAWIVTAVLGYLLVKRMRRICNAKHERLVLPSSDHHVKIDPTLPDPGIFPAYFKNAQGLWIYTRRWLVAKPRAAVFIVHGFGEHIGRYDHFARFLNENGCSVYGIDFQGSGQSHGDRLYMEKFEHLVDEYLQFLKIVQEEKGEPLPPAFLFGHSLGGLLAYNIALRSQNAWTGLLLSGSLVVPDPKRATPFLRKVVTVISRYMPKLVLAPPIEGWEISRNPQNIYAYMNDPLVPHQGICARTGYEMMVRTDMVQSQGRDMSLPILIMHGAADVITLPEGSQILYNCVASKDKTLKLYEGLFHELLQEPEYKMVMQDILDWVVEHLKPAKR